MGLMAVIGSAGRADDAARMSPGLYGLMFAEAAASARRWSASGCVSGGAAFADHVAVRMFLAEQVQELVLFLPAVFDMASRSFVADPSVRFNPGATCNRYHRQFSEACGVDSLAEIAEAARRGARVEVYPGFHRRNSEVASACSSMLALTFGSGSSGDLGPGDPAFGNAREAGLKDGGTAFHGSAAEGENRRKPYQDFLPGDPGFTDPKVAGLRDGGTAHCWGQAWKPKIKRHVRLGALVNVVEQ